jgi:hypothetical protein
VRRTFVSRRRAVYHFSIYLYDITAVADFANLNFLFCRVSRRGEKEKAQTGCASIKSREAHKPVGTPCDIASKC